jgi:hypothetical protein
MVEEMRAERLEADNRRHFTKDRQPIELVREQLDGWTEPVVPEAPEVRIARTAGALRTALADDLCEVG